MSKASKTNVHVEIVPGLGVAGAPAHTTIRVFTPYNDALRAMMKSYRGMRWSDQKCWVIDATHMNFPNFQNDVLSGRFGNAVGALGFTVSMEDDRAGGAHEQHPTIPITDAMRGVPSPVMTATQVSGIPGAAGHFAAENTYVGGRQQGKTAAMAKGASPATGPVNVSAAALFSKSTHMPINPVEQRSFNDLWAVMPDHARSAVVGNGGALAPVTRRFQPQHASEDRRTITSVTFRYAGQDGDDEAQMFLHQFEIAAEFEAVYQKRMIVAHEPGMGKTMTAIVVGCTYYAARRIVVVCPEHLRTMWRKQFRRAGRAAFVYGVDHAAGKAWAATNAGVLIIGYSSAIKTTMAKLNSDPDLQFAYLIVDEGHYCGNHEAQRTQRVTEWGLKCDGVMFLTGTPMPSRIAQLYPMLHVCRPKLYDNFFKFADRYCAAKKTKFGWDFSGASNLEELAAAMRTVMHRRRKVDALDLPTKSRHIVPLTLSPEERAKLDERVSEAWKSVESFETKGNDAGLKALGVLSKVRGYTWDAKRDAVLRWLDDFIESGEKLVMFAHHKSTVEDILTHVRKHYTAFGSAAITGDTNQSMRDQIVENFQKDPGFRVLIGTMGAMSTGVTLTAASHSAFAEYDWVPSAMQQAEDRIHRIGQDNACTIYYLTAEDTIESSMVATLTRKVEIAAQVIDGALSSEAGYDPLSDIVAHLTKQAA